MNQEELIRAVAAKSGTSRYQARIVVGSLLDIVVATVAAGEDVVLANFGTFRAGSYAGRTWRNPKSGAQTWVDAFPVFRFRASAAAQRIVRTGDASARRRKGPSSRSGA